MLMFAIYLAADTPQLLAWNLKEHFWLWSGEMLFQIWEPDSSSTVFCISWWRILKLFTLIDAKIHMKNCPRIERRTQAWNMHGILDEELKRDASMIRWWMPEMDSLRINNARRIIIVIDRKEQNVHRCSWPSRGSVSTATFYVLRIDTEIPDTQISQSLSVCCTPGAVLCCSLHWLLAILGSGMLLSWIIFLEYLSSSK